MLCRDVMTKDVITIDVDETVKTAIKKIMDYKISGLPVVDQEEKLVGIITETDAILKNKKLEVPRFFPSFYPLVFTENFPEGEGELGVQMKELIEAKVVDVMTKRVYTVTEEDPVEEVVKIMSRKGVKRVPVIDEEQRIKGIISQRDIINAYAKDKEV
ncbi:CBS domain-containing protein [Alkaliphilus transvaalensis]|uniref:CBS domain-containing protein n=1 Tax=Alkaliphilus transvaalensis TaxID=114628 RepID=UPI00047C2A53|nr:CBS domain-containing protein [Alkaliphilus transvaalensis]